MVTVAIGLGSNVDAEENLPEAAVLLRRQWPGIRFSRVYRCVPQDIPDQPDFLNAVALFQTDETPQAILAFLQGLERSMAKSPPYRFGPRTIDLDVLLYGERMSADPMLTYPHPRMHRRRFVLEPLCELVNPKSLHPVLGESWEALLRDAHHQPCAPTPLAL